MDTIRKYAPILHTGFLNTYTREQMKEFVSWCDARGFSGFSTEGKSAAPTDDIDGWFSGFAGGIKMAAEEADQKDLDVWLFDEWGYPTGTAGGKTLADHVQWRSKMLRLTYDLALEAGQSVELTAPEHLLAAAVWPVGRAIYGGAAGPAEKLVPTDGKITYTAKHRRERLCVVTWEYDCFRTVGVFKPDPEDDAQGTLDLLSYEGVAFFLQQMYEAYLPYLGDKFGKRVRGFFYDEPFLSFPYPYTFDILDEFKEKKGYDLTDRLPAMLAGLDNAAGIDYRDVCTDRMSKAFYGQLAQWCHEHGVELVGHQDLDHTYPSLDSVSGDFFKNAVQNDSPGVDFIWEQIRPGFFADYPRFAGSVRRLAGKKHAMSESFAAVGNCMNPDYMRFLMQYQAVRGIDRFFLMIADPVPEDLHFMTPVSRDHEQSIHFGAQLNRRIALTNQLLDTASPAGSVAIYYPEEQVFADELTARTNSAANTVPVWYWIEEAARALCYHPVDFDYIWNNAILTLPIRDGAFAAPDGQKISTVVVPMLGGAANEKVLSRLADFAAQGGRVICIGNAPASLLGCCEIAPDAACLKDKIAPGLALNAPLARISLTVRETEERRMYFLLNEDDHAIRTAMPLSGNVQEYDFEAEEWVDVDDEKLDFAPTQLRVLAVSARKAGKSDSKPAGEAICIDHWTAILPEGDKLELASLTDWRDFYRKDYTGWMEYTASFAAEAGTYRLSLGKVCYAAEAVIDGSLYSLPFQPFEKDFVLDNGQHEITVRVLNTKATEVLGDVQKELANRPNMRMTFTSDRKFVESGLLGPVTITPIA